MELFITLFSRQCFGYVENSHTLHMQPPAKPDLPPLNTAVLQCIWFCFSIKSAYLSLEAYLAPFVFCSGPLAI